MAHKIVHVIARLVPEGAEIFVVQLCLKLAQGHDVQLWILGQNLGGEFQQTCLRELSAASVAVHFLGKRTGSDRLSVIRKVRGLLRRERPDVVNSHLEHVGVIVALASAFCKIRQVQTIHSIAIGSRWSLRWLVLRGVHFVAISEILRDAYARELVPPSRMTLILNGVDLGRFPLMLRAPGSVIRFISVGRLEVPKDFPCLIQAACLLKNRVGDRFTVSLVGEGSQRDALQQQVSELGLDGQVSLAGISHAIREKLEQADVYVVSSRWEGLSIALVEAASSGLPIIATAVGGNPEVVVPHVNGYLVGKEDPEALAEAMRVLVEHPERIRAFSESQAALRQRFDITGCASRYAELYQRLVRPRAGEG